MKRLRAQVRKLQAACDAELRKRLALSSGAMVTVDYFALVDLLDYYNETRQAAGRVIRARDQLDGVFFGLDK